MRHIKTQNWNNQQPHYAVIIGKMIDTVPKYITKDGLYFVNINDNSINYVKS